MPRAHLLQQQNIQSYQYNDTWQYLSHHNAKYRTFFSIQFNYHYICNVIEFIHQMKADFVQMDLT